MSLLATPEPPINYGYLLLVHLVCADKQIHNLESQALQDIAVQAHVGKNSIVEMEKILAQDDSQVTLDDVVQRIPPEERLEAVRQMLAIAYIDGFCSTLERDTINKIVQLWQIPAHSISQMLLDAHAAVQQHIETDRTQAALSMGARLLKGADSGLSKALIDKLGELAPENIGRQITKLRREILLAGPDYDRAIEQCTEIARADYVHAKAALLKTHKTLSELGSSLTDLLQSIQATHGQSSSTGTAKEVADNLEKTCQHLTEKIISSVENVQDSLHAKRRALDCFSIAFMGKTKAGKSTLHAVVTGEGWDAIGIGKQRTTRYNRVYEWKHIRIIDTPGIGAPGGHTDEDIAKSIVSEADVICYVVTNDSIQETEFNFLKVIEAHSKPLTILCNIKKGIDRSPERLNDFLSAPNTLFKKEGESGLDGHLARIYRYAKEHYANSEFDVIPVMLLAAQMSQDPAHHKHSKKLYEASRIQDFLDIIRISLIEHGAIRRSQTLLGSTVGDIHSPRLWLETETNQYKKLVQVLMDKQKELKQTIARAKKDIGETLEQDIKSVFQDTLNSTSAFAETHWSDRQPKLERAWKKKVKTLKVESRLKSSIDKANQQFQEQLKESLDEIGNELQLIAQIGNSGFRLDEQESSFFSKEWIKIGSAFLTAAGGILAFWFPPLAALGVIGAVMSITSGFLKSKDQKRRAAVQNIRESLNHQLSRQQENYLRQAQENLGLYCQALEDSTFDYFQQVVQGLSEISQALGVAQDGLSKTENHLNMAYGKRILGWAIDRSLPSAQIDVSEILFKVQRDFPKKEIILHLNQEISFNKPLPEISKVLQEKVSICS